jgi:hypothetical protein
VGSFSHPLSIIFCIVISGTQHIRHRGGLS